MQISPHISKTHLTIASVNTCELELSCCSKDQSWKKGAPLAWSLEAQLPQQSHKIYLTELPLFTEV